MFKELAPLARHRAILFTLTHVEDDQFRVNVIPKKVSDGENDALTTPVSVTGTVEDLDGELPETLLHFVASHLALKNTLERAKAEMEEASKAARAEARKKSAGPATKKESAGNCSKLAASSEAPAPAKPELGKPAGLFDSSPEPVSHCEPNTPASTGKQAANSESDSDDEEDILRGACNNEDSGIDEGA